VIELEKTATLNLRVNPIAKQRAESVLKQLGIPMSTAMDMYLNQIALVGGIPFPVTLPKAPLSVDADRMTDAELVEKLNRGIEDADAGRTRRAADAFREHRSRRVE
jgi:addiction module RelB/DinJ family antitoxin